MKVLVVLVASLFLSVAHAQPYPSKPMRVIVPYAAGGTSDILAKWARVVKESGAKFD